jgi:hypothetical protein
MAGRDEGRHVQRRPDWRAAAPDQALAFQGSAVAGQGSHADEGGDLFAVESAEFGQAADEGAAQDRPDAGRGTQQIFRGPPHGTRLDHVVEVGVHVAQSGARAIGYAA